MKQPIGEDEEMMYSQTSRTESRQSWRNRVLSNAKHSTIFQKKPQSAVTTMTSPSSLSTLTPHQLKEQLTTRGRRLQHLISEITRGEEEHQA